MAIQANESQTGGSAKKTRHRSPNYPCMSLKSAIGKIDTWYKSDGLASATTAAALARMGYENLHGEAARVVSALKSFGLIEEEKGRIKLTQRGINIVAFLADDPRRTEALQQAAVSPAMYRALVEQFQESGLPSDPSLKSELIAVKKFNPNAVEDFIRDFHETLEFAGLSDLGVIELSVEENSSVPAEQSSSPKVRQGQVSSSPTPAFTGGGAPPPAKHPSAEISIPVGVTEEGIIVFAHIRFDAPLKKDLLRSLKATLESLEKNLPGN